MPVSLRQSVEIRRGENMGRTITYANVVRDLVDLGPAPTGNATVAIAPDMLTRVEADAFALVVRPAALNPWRSAGRRVLRQRPELISLSVADSGRAPLARIRRALQPAACSRMEFAEPEVAPGRTVCPRSASSFRYPARAPARQQRIRLPLL